MALRAIRTFGVEEQESGSGSGEFTRLDTQLVNVIHSFESRSAVLNVLRNPAFLDENGLESPTENGKENPLQRADRVLRSVLDRSAALLDEDRRPDPALFKQYILTMLLSISAALMDSGYKRFYAGRGANPFNLLEYYMDALLDIANLIDPAGDGVRAELAQTFEAHVVYLTSANPELKNLPDDGLIASTVHTRRERPSDPVLRAIRPIADGPIIPHVSARRASALLDDARRSSAPPPPPKSGIVDLADGVETDPVKLQLAACAEMDSLFEEFITRRLTDIAESNLRAKEVDRIDGVYDQTLDALFNEAFEIFEIAPIRFPNYTKLFESCDFEDRKVRARLRFIHLVKQKAEALKKDVLPNLLGKINERLPFYISALKRWLNFELGLQTMKDEELDRYIRSAGPDELNKIENLLASGVMNMFARSLINADDGTFWLLHYFAGENGGRLSPLYQPMLDMVHSEMKRMYRPTVSANVPYSLRHRQVGPDDGRYSLVGNDGRRIEVTYTRDALAAFKHRPRVPGGYGMIAAAGDAIAWVKGPTNPKPLAKPEAKVVELGIEDLVPDESANLVKNSYDPTIEVTGFENAHDVLPEDMAAFYQVDVVADPTIEITGYADAKDVLPEDMVASYGVDIAVDKRVRQVEREVADIPDVPSKPARKFGIGKLKAMAVAAVAAVLGWHDAPSVNSVGKNVEDLGMRNTGAPAMLVEVPKATLGAANIPAKNERLAEQNLFHGDKVFAQLMNGGVDAQDQGEVKNLVVDGFIKHLTFLERSGAIDAAAKTRAVNFVRSYLSKLEQGEKIYKIQAKNDPKFSDYLARLKANQSTVNGFNWNGGEALSAYETLVAGSQNMAEQLSKELAEKLEMAL